MWRVPHANAANGFADVDHVCTDQVSPGVRVSSSESDCLE